MPRPVCRSGEFSGSGGAESVGDRNATRGDDWRSVTLTGGEVRRTIGGCGGIGGSCGSLPVPVPTPTGGGVGRPMGCDCSERAARNRGTGPNGIGKSRMSRRLRGTWPPPKNALTGDGWPGAGRASSSSQCAPATPAVLISAEAPAPPSWLASASTASSDGSCDQSGRPLADTPCPSAAGRFGVGKSTSDTRPTPTCVCCELRTCTPHCGQGTLPPAANACALAKRFPHPGQVKFIKYFASYPIISRPPRG